MKRLLCLMLVAMLSFSLFACGSGETTSSNADSSAENASSSSEEISEESKFEPVVPTINGNELKDYTIVYAETNETSKFLFAANALNEYFKATFAVELPVVSENEEATEKEIIIGLSKKRTDDDEYTSAFDYGEYAVEIKGNKLLIVGSCGSGCYQGIEALIEKFNTSADGVFTDMKFDGSGEVLKVSCVGDSITDGSHSSKPVYTYPCYIQQMLGLDYYVFNAGVSGLSVCKNDPLSYMSRSAYSKTLELKPDIIIFGLGTNDANPKLEKYPYKNWEDPEHDRAAEFLESSREMMDAFKEANPDVQIFLIYPASLFVVADDHWQAEPWTDTIVKYVRPLLEQIVDEYDLPTIDCFEWSKENSEIFDDGLHPFDEHYEVFAKYIYDNIKDTVKKPQ